MTPPTINVELESMMKRTPLLFAIALSAAVSAAPPAGNGPNRDSVLGGGKSFSDIINVVAHSGPNGEGAFGHVQARNVPGFSDQFDIEFDVTCLRVDGDLATIGGRATKLVNTVGYTIEAYPGIIQFVRDGRSTGTPDTISAQYPVNYVPTSCPAPSSAFTAYPLLQGNIGVTDE